MKELVTGGEGYIGRNLMKVLEDPISYDIKSDWDILEPELLEEFIEDSDCVYHLAALPGVKQCEENPVSAWQVNTEGTFNVARFCEKHEKPFVVASSFAVISENPTVYGFTKSVCEIIAMRYGGLAARISNVYGGDGFLELKDTAVARLMKGTFEDRGHGEERRDFIHVDEVCKQLKRFMEAQAPPTSFKGVIHVQTAKWITINTLVALSKSSRFPDNIKSWQDGLNERLIPS